LDYHLLLKLFYSLFIPFRIFIIESGFKSISVASASFIFLSVTTTILVFISFLIDFIKSL